MQGTYSIKDLERLTGIKAHTIRIWEKRYQAVSPKRTDTNIRFYCDDDLKRLLNISILLKHGFKISKLADLSDEDISEKIINNTFSAHNTDSQIENLVVAMIELDNQKFEKIISNATLAIGFENVITDIIYPFLEQIGILWLTGGINPAQEHFVSNLVRQKLLVAIDSLIVKPKANSKRYILYLPENELHELGLLFYSYLVRKSGNKIIYLGQSVPFDDLIEVSKFKAPDVLVTSITSAMAADTLSAYLKKLSESFSDVDIYFTGYQAQIYKGSLPSNVKVLMNANEFKDQLSL